ncbi:hypothetical protein BLA29_001722 [Euroglyphus maynei]|uniref:Uncharacterized protein n=1 Tax=Euroglyphus maynei TaxID=6958 RepID=A0A1Y3BQ23_EURMA|nr:hypothetical protein BLA29_001722 [Euroglyphus maynei]
MTTVERLLRSSPSNHQQQQQQHHQSIKPINDLLKLSSVVSSSNLITIPISSILNGRNSNISSNQHQHLTNPIIEQQFQFNQQQQQSSASNTTNFGTNDNTSSMIRPSNTTSSPTVVESTSTSIVKIVDHIDQHRTIVGLHHPISCKAKNKLDIIQLIIFLLL